MAYIKGPYAVRDNGRNSGEWVELIVEGRYYDDDSELIVAKLDTVRTRNAEGRFEDLENAQEVYDTASLLSCAPEMEAMLRDLINRRRLDPKDRDKATALLRKAGVLRTRRGRQDLLDGGKGA